MRHFALSILLATTAMIMSCEKKNKDKKDDSSGTVPTESGEPGTTSSGQEGGPPEGSQEITMECQTYSFPFRTNRALAVDPTDADTVYVGVEQKGVFKTTDGGATWTKISTGITGFKKTNSTELCYEEFRDLVVAPSNPSVLYTAHMGGPKRADEPLGAHNGVYYSSDGGATWERRVFAEMNVGLYALAVDPTNPSVIYAGAGATPDVSINTKGSVYKSSDAGKTWTELTMAFEPGTSTNSLAVDPTNGQIVYAATWGIGEPDAWGSKTTGKFGIEKSTDGGATWTALSTGMTNGKPKAIEEVRVSPTNPSILFAANSATQNGEPRLYMSQDGGATFSTPSNINTDIDVAAFDPADTTGQTLLGFSISSNKMWESTDAGVTWADVGTLPADIPSVIRLTSLVFAANDPNIVYLSGSHARVYRSVDRGRTFTMILSADTLPE